jgi:hypothetical protein
MAVVFRDRPFLTQEFRTSDGALASFDEQPWFDPKRTPLFTLPHRSILSSEVGRSGVERKNAFFASVKMRNALGSAFIDMTRPLWNDADIQRHGFRRLDIMTRYVSEPMDLLFTSQSYRRRVRDYHCLNHLFYNGVIRLGHGRPDIRIGGRARIPGRDRAEDETYYIENVSHSWSLGLGMRTSLGVTRGWIGTDNDLETALTEMIDRYSTQPGPVSPTVAIGGEVV